MHKLTIEVDLDLFTDSTCAAEIVTNLIGEMELLRESICQEDPKVENASGLIVSPLEDDELVGNWRIDPK